MVRAPDPDGAGAGNYTPAPRLGHINIGSLDSDPVGANDGDMYYNVNSQGLRVYDWTDSAWKQISSTQVYSSSPYARSITFLGQLAWDTTGKNLYVANSFGTGPTGYSDWRPAVNLSAYAPLSSPSFEGTVNFGTADFVNINFGVSPKSATVSINGTFTVEAYSGIELKSASREIRWLNGNGTGYTQLSDTYTGASNITINLPSSAGTLIGTGDTGTVTNTMLAGSIALTKLAQTSATNGQVIAWNGTSWAPANASSGVSSNNPSFTGTITIAGATSGQSVVSAPAVAGTNTSIVLPSAAGTLVGTGDSGSVTDAMLAGSISPSKVTGTAAVLGANTFTSNQTVAATNPRVTLNHSSGSTISQLGADAGTGFVGTTTNNSFNIVTNNTAVIASTNVGATTIQTGTASAIPLTIKNTATPTTSLTEWRSGSGSTLLRYVNSSGRVYGSQGIFNGIDQYAEAVNYLSDAALPQDIWTDKLRFRLGYYETSTDGTTWTWGTYSPSVTDGRIDTTVNVTTSPSYYRWSWQASDISYSSAMFVRLTTTYSGTVNQFSLTVESSADGTTWTNRNYGGSALTGLGTNGSQARWIAAMSSSSGDSYFRVTIRNTGANTIPIAAIELLTPRAGDQGGPTPGTEANLPLSWDANKQVTFSPSAQSGVPLIARPMTTITASVAGATGTGTVVTYTTTNPHGLVTGQQITVAGTNGGLYDIATSTTITVTGYKTFTVSASNTGTWTSGGTITMLGSGDIARFYHPNGSTISGFDNAARLYIRQSGPDNSSAVSVFTSADSSIGVSVRGNGSSGSFTQTADIQRWQVYDGTTATTVSRIDKNGCLIAAEPQGSTTSGAGTTVTLDCSVSTTHNLTFGAGNITGVLLTNVPRNGSFTVTLVLKQDSVGGRTITWSGNQINGSATNATPKWASGTAPTLSTAANAVDIVTLVVNRTNNATDAVYGFLAGKAFA